VIAPCGAIFILLLAADLDFILPLNSLLLLLLLLLLLFRVFRQDLHILVAQLLALLAQPTTARALGLHAVDMEPLDATVLVAASDSLAAPVSVAVLTDTRFVGLACVGHWIRRMWVCERWDERAD